MRTKPGAAPRKTILSYVLPIGRISALTYTIATLTLSALAVATTLALGQTQLAQITGAAITLAPGPAFFAGCRFADPQSLNCGIWGERTSLALWAGFFWVSFCISSARLRDVGRSRRRLAILYLMLFAAQLAAAAALSYADAARLIPPASLAYAGVVLLAVYWMAHAFLRIWPGRARYIHVGQ